MDKVPKNNIVSVNFSNVVFCHLDVLILEYGKSRLSRHTSKEFPSYLRIVQISHARPPFCCVVRLG
jgi:hypothetical protein